MASLVAENTATVLWARRKGLADEINLAHTNNDYLPGFQLHPQLRATSSIEEAVREADVVAMAVPSHGFRAILSQVVEYLRPWVPVVSLAKGLEQGSLLRMTEVVHEVAPGHPAGVLTGPNLAMEILSGHAAAAVVAMADPAVATELQRVFSTDRYRVYFNDDVIGAEMAGVLKNVIAIASGMADGLGTGDNTRAAVITRGLAEMTRLGCAMGGNALTFSGLAGLGDLLATCMSQQSRNRHVGEELGKGRVIDEILAETRTIAEGVKSCGVVLELAGEHGVEMPIAREVMAVISHGRTAAEAYQRLLQRDLRYEHHGLDGL